jgi:hypothetical protein
VYKVVLSVISALFSSRIGQHYRSFCHLGQADAWIADVRWRSSALSFFCHFCVMPLLPCLRHTVSIMDHEE